LIILEYIKYIVKNITIAKSLITTIIIKCNFALWVVY